MNDTTALRSVRLRRAVTGLLSFAAAEEQELLAAAALRPDYDRGSPDRWAAVPVVAHNNQFKGQQAERISAIRSGQVPAGLRRGRSFLRRGLPGLQLASAAGTAVLAGCRRMQRAA